MKRGILKQSFNAHNLHGEFPTANEAYNKDKKLGRLSDRVALQGIARDIYGVGNDTLALTKKQLEARDIYLEVTPWTQ
jgi:hypothetical protein